MALPSGRLQVGVIGLMGEAGLTLASGQERCYVFDAAWTVRAAQLVFPQPLPEVRAKLFKPRAIPQLVGLGNYDAGFCGLDLLQEACSDEVVPVLNLGLNRVSLVAAAHIGRRDILSNPPRRPLVIATEYPNISGRWAHERGLAHIIIQTYGKTEAFLPEDADIIFDCIETGETLAANDLVVIDRIMESATWMIAGKKAFAQDSSARPGIDVLKYLIEGAMKTRGGT